MKAILSSPRWRSAACVMAALAGATGCQRDDVSPLSNGPATPPLTVGLEVSSPNAQPGDTIAVAVHDTANLGEALQGLQGYIHFDPSQLAYVGQAAGGRTLLIVNDRSASKGELRLITV